MPKIGKYEVIEEIGRGAMGVVYRCHDPSIPRYVAIKVIRAQGADTMEETLQARQRFAREASAAGRLNHPNIVTVHELGEVGDFQYLVMEFVDGQPMDRGMGGHSLPILRQIAAALDYAHEQKVVHRDIKPSNILVSSRGLVKVTDFGVARIASETVTVSGTILGTPQYMAPEQVLSSRVDGRADQFSLAVVAYESLTGRMPFVGETAHAVMFAVVQGERPTAHEVNRALPPAVSAVLKRGLAQNAGDRYATCSEFVAALSEALEPTVVERLPPVGTVVRGRRFGLGLAIGVVALAAVAGGIYIAGHKSAGPAKVAVGNGEQKGDTKGRANSTGEVPAQKPQKTQERPAHVAGETGINPRDGLAYVWIPAGKFDMGCSPGDFECKPDEQPVHRVTLTRDFRLCQTPVTHQAYERVTGKKPSYFFLAGPNAPVEQVSWDASQSYCRQIGGRLPTEAEWEYAARGGTAGSRYGELDKIGWSIGNSWFQPHDVRGKMKNGFGLYDMLGNVMEWTADWYGGYDSSAQSDPPGPANGQDRVIRGGSWGVTAKNVRVSGRVRPGSGIAAGSIGLRCVWE